MNVEPSNEEIKKLIHLFQSGHLLEAKVLAERQINSYPKSIWGWKVLGAIYGEKGNFTEALRINTKVVELSPNDPESYNNLGVTLQELGRIKEAEENYKRAIKKSIQSTMSLGAEGIKVTISGRVNGVDIARSETFKEGRIPLHTLRANIDYSIVEALTTYGIIGVKVWIYKGEIRSKV